MANHHDGGYPALQLETLTITSKACDQYAIWINTFTVDPPLKGKISKAIPLESMLSLKSLRSCRLYTAISIALCGVSWPPRSKQWENIRKDFALGLSVLFPTQSLAHF